MGNPPEHRHRLRSVVLTVVGLGVAVWLLNTVSWRDLGQAVGRLRWPELVLAFGIYVVFLALKAARFAALLRLRAGFGVLIGAVCLQTFWSNFLPMRSGDISYVLVMSQRSDVRSSRAAASLIVAGVLDLLGMLALATGIALYLARIDPGARGLNVVAAVAAVGFCAGVVIVALSRALSHEHVENVAHRVARVRVAGTWVSQVLLDLREQTWSRGFLLGAVCSALALMFRYGFQILLLRAMYREFTAAQGLFALSLAGVANMLPIQGVANIGSIELPWAWASRLASVPAPVAIASGFALHGVVLAFAVGSGLIGILLTWGFGDRPSTK